MFGTLHTNPRIMHIIEPHVSTKVYKYILKLIYIYTSFCVDITEGGYFFIEDFMQSCLCCKLFRISYIQTELNLVKHEIGSHSQRMDNAIINVGLFGIF